MNGINILNAEEILVTPGWVDVCFAIATIVFILSIVFVYNDFEIIPTVFGVLFLLSGISVVIFCALSDSYTEPTGRYRYEVTIDDSVKLSELYDRYNVVEQRGDIWVLEYKE